MRSICYADIYTSLLRFCSEVVGHITANNQDIQLQVVNLDSVPTLAALPEGDLVIIHGWYIEASDQEFGIHVYANLGFRVVNDVNNMRLETIYLNHLVERLVKQCYVVPIYANDSLTGEVLGHLQFSQNFEGSPAKLNDSSTFKSIFVELLTPQELNHHADFNS